MAGKPRKVVFWDVDTQADFMQPEGKLYVPGAERLRPNLKRLTEYAAANGILVLGDVDAHQVDDPEFKVYPPHCLAGTPGAEKVPETVLPRQYRIPNRKVALPTDLFSYQQIMLEKQTLDVFDNPNTEDLLKELGQEPEVVVYGVVTECCVRLAAKGLLERGYRISLVTDAIRAWDEAKGKATLEMVNGLGGRLVTTE
ncbi:MAG: cysteine hydrolase family protein, partial [Candidatus Acidiferrales bacterium]